MHDIISLKGMRGMIASKMDESMKNSAQLTYCAEIDATELSAYRKAINETSQIKVGYEDVFIEALGHVLPQHLSHNAKRTEKGAEISSDIHISVAVAVASGLMAPTVFDVSSKTITEISSDRRDLLKRANSGKLTVAEMTGGSFTISNLGLTRIRYFTPILNSPQVAMLGIGRTEERPVVIDGNIVVRPMIGLSLTVDHKFIDGEPSGRFLSDLCEFLETKR